VSLVDLGEHLDVLKRIKKPPAATGSGRRRTATMWRGFDAAIGHRMTRGPGRAEVNLNVWFGPTSRDHGVIKPVVHSVLRLYPHLAFHRVAYQRSYPGSPAQDEHTDVGSRNGPSYFTLLVPLDNPSPSEAGFTQFINPEHRLTPPRFGQGLLFRGDVAHFGTGNHTTRNRDFVYFTFAPARIQGPKLGS
jgi:hypothetical protein